MRLVSYDSVKEVATMLLQHSSEFDCMNRKAFNVRKQKLHI